MAKNVILHSEGYCFLMHRKSCGRAREAWGGGERSPKWKTGRKEGRKEEEWKQKENKTLARWVPLSVLASRVSMEEEQRGA